MINKKAVSRIQKGKGNYVFVHYNDGSVGIVGMGANMRSDDGKDQMKEYMIESVDPERRMMMERQVNQTSSQETVEDLPEKVERLKSELGE